MSKYNNVNPGQYKTAGRLRMGEAGTQEQDRQVMADAKKASPGRPPRAARAARPAKPTTRPRG